MIIEAEGNKYQKIYFSDRVPYVSLSDCSTVELEIQKKGA